MFPVHFGHSSVMRQPGLDTFPGLPLFPDIHPLSMTASQSNGPNVDTEQQNAINTILQLLFSPTVHIQSINSIRGTLHSLRVLVLSNGVRLLLKSAPRPTTALLRRERSLLDTEALVLSRLGQSAHSLIPRLLHYDPRGHELGYPFLIREYVGGSTLKDMNSRLTPQKRSDIERQLGQIVKIIGQQVALSFGPLDQVAGGSGKQSWREAFIVLIESVLRDAEDMFINLPYSQIRPEIGRLASTLEEIKSPRLVIIDIGKPSHILVNPESKQLSGVVDFGHAICGDVYMAEIFENPSSAVMEGFGSRLPISKTSHIRSLLYSCYRSVHTITLQYYRDRNETIEMNARRRLTAIIAEMASIDIDL